MEMYVHRCGFQLREPMATHSRKRYRLVSATPANQNGPAPDPALWLVHYCRADTNDHVPSNRIPISPQIHTSITQREYLRTRGQLVREEFMLYDRNNWPTVSMPAGPVSGQSFPGMAYPNNVMRNQQPYGLPQQAINQSGMGPSPAKRLRQTGPNHGHGPSRAYPIAPQNPALDDEDIGTGDTMDILTPRDISTNRYMQHHEWMEEVFSSPYGTSQIVPIELGLGRKGEIESLTRDFFSAPTKDLAPTKDSTTPSRVGRLEPGKAEDFSQLATRRVGQIQAEMERLKKQHARRMAKLNDGLAIKEAEQKLRALGINSHDRNGSTKTFKVQSSSVDEILGRVETELGKNLKILRDIHCVQKGGLEEKPQVSETGLRNFDFEEMADFSDQQVHSTSYPTPQAASSRGYGSTGHTPRDFAMHPPVTGDGAQEHEPPEVLPSGDITMTEMAQDSGAKDAEAGDWIMVDKSGGVSRQENQATPDVESIMNNAALEGNLDTPGHDLDTAGAALQDFAPDTVAEDFNDFGEGVDFGNLDTAGEALSGYDEHTGMGLDEHGLDLDDSAFGEAFHATEAAEQQEKSSLEA